jgi:hypothetical protein
MKDKFSFENPDYLKTEIKDLISFKEKEKLQKKSGKATDKNTNNSGVLSKYAKVLSCSFVKGTRDATSAEKRIGAEKG